MFTVLIFSGYVLEEENSLHRILRTPMVYTGWVPVNDHEPRPERAVRFGMGVVLE